MFFPHAKATALFLEQSADKELFVSLVVLLSGKHSITGESNLWYTSAFASFYFLKKWSIYWQTHPMFFYCITAAVFFFKTLKMHL